MAAASSLTPHWTDPNQVNDTWLQPRIGHAEMTPTGAYEAGSYASLTITYAAGYFGIDDTGAVRVVTRFATDMGRPQFNDPVAATARSWSCGSIPRAMSGHGTARSASACCRGFCARATR
jgi:hypothetical protein